MTRLHAVSPYRKFDQKAFGGRAPWRAREEPPKVSFGSIVSHRSGKQSPFAATGLLALWRDRQCDGSPLGSVFPIFRFDFASPGLDPTLGGLVPAHCRVSFDARSRRSFIMQGLACLAVLASTLMTASTADNTVVQQRVDLIELNHFIDDSGRHVFDQLIFYDWSAVHGRYHVRAWRLVKTPTQLPVRHWNPASYRCVWHDDGVLREVWSPLYRETWSQNDPERENRKLLAEDKRPDFRQPAPVRR